MKNIDRIMYMYDHIDLRGYIRRNVTNPEVIVLNKSLPLYAQLY